MCSELTLTTSGSKRKATEEPGTPSDSKRIKSSHSEEPENMKKNTKPGNPIPFPEKVILPVNRVKTRTDSF